MNTWPPGSPSPLHKPTDFAYFPKLPPELRLKILKFCSFLESERIVEVTYERNIGKLISLSLPPALLSVNREARVEAKRLFDKLPQQFSDDPPIYFDYESDILFIREDTRGIMSDQNLLLAAIFGAGANVASANLPEIKHLMLDWWVLSRACWNLAPLTRLRKLDSFRIIMKKGVPQNTRVNYPPKMVPSSRTALCHLKKVGWPLYEILGAVWLFWGPIDYGLALAIRRALTDAEAGIVALQQIDTSWEIPRLQLMTFGYY